ncbi:retrovirus-related pol polyprotein from transposon TNT 1-94 [Tanacetum coccineum]
MIKKVYYVEGLNNNLFSVGQFCDADLEVTLRKSTCFVRDLLGNDLLTSTCDLISIEFLFMNLLQQMQFASWPRLHRLKHGYGILKYVKDQLCSSRKMGKGKCSNFKTKTVPSSKGRLHLLHMNLCGPMPVESIKGKKYILVIVDEYSRYTWTHFLRSKDETPETYFKEEGINHQITIAQTLEQNDVVERQNHTLVEAPRTMLSASKLPLFFWAEAIKTACYTHNRSLIIPRHEKTPYHIINERKLTLKFLYIFCCTCYIVRDGENLDKMKEKGDPCIFIGYAT